MEKRSSMIWGVASLAAILVTLLGWWQSPIERFTGRPLLLIPEVKAVADYQVQARGWVDQFQSLDASITGLLLDTNGDLFSQSQQGNHVQQQAVQMAQTVDQTKAPATLIGLHTDLKAISLGYLDAARLALRYLATPSPENRAVAQSAVDQSRAKLDGVKASEWITR
jgi:hypothetical protein